MDRIHNYAAGEEVESADLNNIQDAALGIDQAKYLWIKRPVIACAGGVTGTAVVSVGGTRGLVMGSEVVLPSAAGANLDTTGLVPGWHYIYAFNNSGVIGYEVSATVPDATRTYKSTDTSRRYVGCFPVYNDGSNNMVAAFACVNGRFLYRASAMAFAFLRVVNTGTATGAGATVSLAGPVPPHASLAILRARLWKDAAVGGTNYSCSLTTYGDTAAPSFALEASGPASTETIATWQHIEIQPAPNAGAPSITYANDAATTTLRLWVVGFVEE